MDSKGQPPNNQQVSFLISPSVSQGKNPANLLSLPEFKPVTLNLAPQSYHSELAEEILAKIHNLVATWKQESQRLQRQIEETYLSGPLVDGWLESHPPQEQADLAQPSPGNPESSESNLPATLPGYYLHGRREDGRVYTQPCPPEQVADVSVAIARYQKLTQLLQHKQKLDNRLSRLTASLQATYNNLTERDGKPNS